MQAIFCLLRLAILALSRAAHGVFEGSLLRWRRSSGRFSFWPVEISSYLRLFCVPRFVSSRFGLSVAAFVFVSTQVRTGERGPPPSLAFSGFAPLFDGLVLDQPRPPP